MRTAVVATTDNMQHNMECLWYKLNRTQGDKWRASRPNPATITILVTCSLLQEQFLQKAMRWVRSIKILLTMLALLLVITNSQLAGTLAGPCKLLAPSL